MKFATEHQEQCALIEWARLQRVRWPELVLLHAIPNGGWRSKATAAKLKAEGVCAGVPDLLLPVARRGYHSCWIELKAKRGRASADQLIWVEALRSQGNLVSVIHGWEAARTLLEWYLQGGLHE